MDRLGGAVDYQPARKTSDGVIGFVLVAPIR